MSIGEAMWGQIREGAAPTPETVGALASLDRVTLGAGRVRQLQSQLSAEVFGAGPLEELLALPGVTDVLVNGTDGVWIDRGEGLEPTACEVGDAAAVRRLAVRLATSAGRRLDETSPFVDGLLPGGVRLHAVLPPLVPDAAHISLRVPRQHTPTLEELQANSTICPFGAEVLDQLVRARAAFVVSGGTGSGKTTLLGALLSRVPPSERIVVVEDVRELRVEHPHVVALQGRTANVEGAGAVPLEALVRQSLRMRPDRLVVGEVRGAEVRELLSALNTGHDGGCGTVHANTATDVLARFEALGALAGMSQHAVRSQLVSAVKVVVHLRREPAGRVVSEVGVIGWDGDALRVQPALARRDGALRRQDAWPVLAHVLGSAR
ncbi:TadA family conjugal transfer-associated ATPase [Allobranchiibius sp. CTAmp26]|uniref:TadA family conjugal transfer-associated ATPase n=1 Tax=Allobranchiibius sp. CTAmp26 TaxID=2815214 RepID=UPI0027DAD575|nr:TadA family conjugal transfer-associated ATPase [Allobranchiibius sp. CTAmp26]